MVEQERVGGEGERDGQEAERREGPVRSSSRVTSSVPTTGIVGPLQSGWLPMVSTNGVSRNTDSAVISRAGQIQEPPAAGGRAPGRPRAARRR